MIDREALRTELVRAAGGNVESVTRQDFLRKPLTQSPQVISGRDPVADFDRYWQRGFRLYCYRSINARERATLGARTSKYRCNLAAWYDVREQEAFILQITPSKLVKFPSELDYLAAFWVAIPPESH